MCWKKCVRECFASTTLRDLRVCNLGVAYVYFLFRDFSGGFCMYVFGGFCKGLDVPCCFYKTSMLELMEVSPFSLIEIACIFLFMIFPVGR